MRLRGSSVLQSFFAWTTCPVTFFAASSVLVTPSDLRLANLYLRLYTVCTQRRLLLLVQGRRGCRRFLSRVSFCLPPDSWRIKTTCIYPLKVSTAAILIGPLAFDRVSDWTFANGHDMYSPFRSKSKKRSGKKFCLALA